MRLRGWVHAPDSPEQEAARGSLRRPRSDPGRGTAPRGRGPPDPQAQHRQHRTLRLRGTRGDPGRHHPSPAGVAGLQRLAGDLLRAHRGHALLPVARPARDQRRGRLHRQRRLRADRHGAAGVPRRRQRDPGARARLPAVDRRDHALGRYGGALPLRRGERLESRPGRHRVEDHREHPRAGDHQPEQPDGRGLQRGHRQGPDRHRASPPAGRLRRRDLREDPLRGRPAPPRRDLRRQRRAVPDLQRAVQGLPRLRLPRRLADDLRARRSSRPTSSRA